jgi:hypothetical protein
MRRPTAAPARSKLQAVRSEARAANRIFEISGIFFRATIA